MKDIMAVSGQDSEKQFSSSTTSIDSVEGVFCQPCDRNRSRLPAHGYCTICAEHLCEICVTVHRGHTMSRYHTVLDQANMPQTVSSISESQSDNLIKSCSKHNSNTIKYYCHDHEALLCHVCVTTEHTQTSCKVNFIPDLSGQIINSKEYQDVKKTVNELTEEANRILQDMKKANETSNKFLTDALKDIKRFRTKLNERVDELEKEVKETAEDILKENSRKMEIVEKECRDILNYLNASSDTITHFNISKQSNNLFMELKLAEQMIKGYEKSFVKLTAFDAKEYKFEPNETISNLLSKETSFGTLKVLHCLKSIQVSDMGKIRVETARDSNKCGITGMTLHTSNLLIITDDYNMAVKMVDISRKSVVDQEKLDSNPWDISSVSNGKIAVTIPFKNTIQFLSVARNNLKKEHSLKVDGRCHGISCHKDKMVVSFYDPGKVQIILNNGTVLQTIQDKNVFKYPGYVLAGDNYIYVSDTGMKTISKLNWQGEVKGKYVCRSKPCGLIKSDDGTVFVCFCNGNTIREILEDFTKEQTVVDDIEDPQAVCWSAETCTLYTSSRTWDRENDNFIKIFKISKESIE